METLTLDDICRLLQKKRQTIYNDLNRKPNSLPPRIIIPGTRRLLWRRDVVDAWIASHSPAVDLPVDNGLGRPRKGSKVSKKQPSDLAGG